MPKKKLTRKDPLTKSNKTYIRTRSRRIKRGGGSREDVENFIYEMGNKAVKNNKPNYKNKKDREWIQDFLKVLFPTTLILILILTTLFSRV